jgi:hypothetical protein
LGRKWLVVTTALGGVLLAGKGAKLIAIILVAVVVASGLGYWLLAPKMPGEVATFTSVRSQTSLSTSSEETSTIPTTSVSQASTTSSSATTLWINITATRSVSYYLGLLQSNGTEPYVSLARELRKLPDVTNATAVAKITFLALNATDPKVKEAFELMMKGGTPDPRDFKYAAPNCNTELQVLYWLACQNEFKKDDTLALAIAMVNGLWVTIGDDQVQAAVFQYTNDFLNFLRETNELEKQRGYFQLENYPLEAKVALAWPGGQSTANGPHSLWRLRDEGKRVRLNDYHWDNLAILTLRSMRKIMDDKNWITNSTDNTIASLEYYFFFDSGLTRSTHWIRTDEPPYTLNRTLVIAGEEVPNNNMVNANFEFEYFVQNGKGIGACSDEAVLIDAFAKSWGIATTTIVYNSGRPDDPGHAHIVYYDPDTQTFKAYPQQLMIAAGAKYPQRLFIYRPIHPGAVMVFASDKGEWIYNCWYIFDPIEGTKIRDMFLNGFPTIEFRKVFLDFTQIRSKG